MSLFTLTALLHHAWSFLVFTPSLLERHLAHPVLLCPVHGHEPHVVHRIWRSPSRRHEWRLAYHGQHGCWSHLLRHVLGSRNQLGPILGRIPSPVSREGNHLTCKTFWRSNSGFTVRSKSLTWTYFVNVPLATSAFFPIITLLNRHSHILCSIVYYLMDLVASLWPFLWDFHMIKLSRWWQTAAPLFWITVWWRLLQMSL